MCLGVSPPRMYFIVGLFLSETVWLTSWVTVVWVLLEHQLPQGRRHTHLPLRGHGALDWGSGK